MSNNEKRFDDGVKLFLAMGEIDDKLIEEARRQYPIFFTVKRTAVLVATLLLIAVVGVAAILFAPAFMPAKDAAPENNLGSDGSKYLGVGDKVVLDDGSSIELVDKTAAKYSFVIHLAKDIDEIDIYVYGYSKQNLPALTPVAATTADKRPANYGSMDMPRILVNGNETQTLPSDEGTYLLTIDFSEIKDTYILDRIGISYFEAVFNYN